MRHPTLEVVLMIKVKPVYAPSVVLCWFRANAWRLATIETIARETDIDIKVVGYVLQQLHKEKKIFRRISHWRGKTYYYWIDSSLHQPPPAVTVRDPY